MKYIQLMKIGTHGELIGTFPTEVLMTYGFVPNGEVVIEERHEGLLLRPKLDDLPLGDLRERQMNEWLQKFTGSAAGSMTTDELMHMTRGED